MLGPCLVREPMIFSVRVIATKCRHYSVSMIFSRRVVFFTLICSLLFVLVFTPPIPWLDPTQYQGYVLAFQAVGILATLGIATVTFRGDSRDRRVDRVLALHNELTSGEVGAVRRRLAAHFRQHGPRDGSKQWVLQTTTEQLKKRSDLSRYRDDGLKQTPSEDAAVLLRFFQRAQLAQATGSLDDYMCASLIGAHAGWWNLAIQHSGKSEPMKTALNELATWANNFAKSHSKESQFKNWGETRKEDFKELM